MRAFDHSLFVRGSRAQTLVVGLGLLPITVAIKCARASLLSRSQSALPNPTSHPRPPSAPLPVRNRSARTLARLSTVSLAFVLVFTFAVVVSALAQAALEQSEQAAPLPPLELWRPTGAPIAIPVLAFAFSAHSLIFPVYASLKQPTPRRMGTIARRSLLAVSSIYGIIGVCGYKCARWRSGADGTALRSGAVVSLLTRCFTGEPRLQATPEMRML